MFDERFVLSGRIEALQYNMILDHLMQDLGELCHFWGSVTDAALLWHSWRIQPRIRHETPSALPRHRPSPPRHDRASRPSELIQIRGHQMLSLNARRAITLLWHNAHRQGLEINKRYTIEIDALMPARHKGYEMVEEAVVALMQTILTVTGADGSTWRVQFLGGNNMASPSRPAGVLTYNFDPILIELLQDSRIWGKISLPVLMSFSSKYAISLYEHVAQWTGLQQSSKILPIGDFRELLGIDRGNYVIFGGLNRSVIKPSVAEINALAAFNLTIMPVKTSRKVTHIHLSWWLKSDQENRDAWDEISRARVGRKARIANQVENVLPASPSQARRLRDIVIDD
jgi:hypothetical protein